MRRYWVLPWSVCDTDIVYALLLVTIVYVVPELTATEIEVVGDAAEGTIAFANWTRLADAPGNQAFVENCQATYGIEPEPWAAQSYVALYILAFAISKAQSTEAVAVREVMAGITEIDTILGPFPFNADGDAVYDLNILIVENGEFVLLE